MGEQLFFARAQVDDANPSTGPAVSHEPRHEDMLAIWMGREGSWPADRGLKLSDDFRVRVRDPLLVEGPAGTE